MSNNIERRTVNIELRADATDSRSIEGYAALFNTPSSAAGWYVEEIAPGAFAEALKRSEDTVALFNHDDNMVLARYPDTLELKEDEKGLWYRIAEMPKSREDVLEAIQRKDVRGSSFAFTVKADAWEYNNNDIPKRTITEIDILYDVSPVTYPFYKTTSVYSNSDAAKRSFDQWAEAQKEETESGKNSGEEQRQAGELKAFNEWLERTLQLRKEFL